MMVPSEANVCLDWENVFPIEEVRVNVKKAVKHLAHVLRNVAEVHLYLETSINCPELPASKSNESLSAWMFSVLSARYACNEDDGCHRMFWALRKLFLNAFDSEKERLMFNGKAVTKIVGINLQSVCTAFNDHSNEEIACDLESVGSDMFNVPFNDMQDKLVEHTRLKCKYSQKALHQQHLIYASERAITKRHHATTTNVAERAVNAAEAALRLEVSESSGKLSNAVKANSNADLAETNHDGADFSRAEEDAPSNTPENVAAINAAVSNEPGDLAAPSGINKAPKLEPMPMIMDIFNRGLMSISEDLD